MKMMNIIRDTYPILGIALILIKAPAPMLIAVGMYLPFPTTSAVFVGGVFRAIMDWFLGRRDASEEEKTKAENSGVLVASGLIAGGAIIGASDAIGNAFIKMTTGSTAAKETVHIFKGDAMDGIPAEVVSVPPNKILRPDLQIDNIDATTRWRTFWHLQEDADLEP